MGPELGIIPAGFIYWSDDDNDGGGGGWKEGEKVVQRAYQAGWREFCFKEQLLLYVLLLYVREEISSLFVITFWSCGYVSEVN